MAPIGTLWGSTSQRQSKVILSVAAVNEFELERPEWAFHNKPLEFTTKFPYGKIPTFEGLDGFKLIEGSTIARYLSSIGTKANLLGSNAQDIAIVDQWVHFAEHEIGAPAVSTLGIVYGFFGSFSLEVIDKNAERLARGLDHLESHLATQPSGYVALGTLTLADFVVVGVILSAAMAALGSAERAKYPHVFAHYDKVTGDKRVAQYWGKKEFADVRITEARKYPI